MNKCVSMKTYGDNFAMSKSCRMQSNTFERSINVALTTDNIVFVKGSSELFNRPYQDILCVILLPVCRYKL